VARRLLNGWKSQLSGVYGGAMCAAASEIFITTTAGERLSFGCAGPAKSILFMCFQALKISFRVHQ